MLIAMLALSPLASATSVPPPTAVVDGFEAGRARPYTVNDVTTGSTTTHTVALAGPAGAASVTFDATSKTGVTGSGRAASGDVVGLQSGDYPGRTPAPTAAPGQPVTLMPLTVAGADDLAIGVVGVGGEFRIYHLRPLVGAPAVGVSEPSTAMLALVGVLLVGIGLLGRRLRRRAREKQANELHDSAARV